MGEMNFRITAYASELIAGKCRMGFWGVPNLLKEPDKQRYEREWLKQQAKNIVPSEIKWEPIGKPHKFQRHTYLR